VLDLKSISKTFNAGTVNEKTALNNLCLHLNDGDFVTVIGGNGAGKSTMLNAVAGAWPVDEGTIEIGGVNVTKLPEYKRAKYLGRVFQDPMTGTAVASMSPYGKKPWEVLPQKSSITCCEILHRVTCGQEAATACATTRPILTAVWND